jgi:hypothetical protein
VQSLPLDFDKLAEKNLNIICWQGGCFLNEQLSNYPTVLVDPLLDLGLTVTVGFLEETL